MGRKSSSQEFDDVDADFIGRQAIVENKIGPDSPGKIEFNGTLWTATADIHISKGTRVQVIEKNNLTLKVKPLHEERSKS